jgi:hypothetical protein
MKHSSLLVLVSLILLIGFFSEGDITGESVLWRVDNNRPTLESFGGTLDTDYWTIYSVRDQYNYRKNVILPKPRPNPTESSYVAGYNPFRDTDVDGDVTCDGILDGKDYIAMWQYYQESKKHGTNTRISDNEIGFGNPSRTFLPDAIPSVDCLRRGDLDQDDEISYDDLDAMSSIIYGRNTLGVKDKSYDEQAQEQACYVESEEKVFYGMKHTCVRNPYTNQLDWDIGESPPDGYHWVQNSPSRGGGVRVVQDFYG